MDARLARFELQGILRRARGAVEEYVALITAKSEPLVKETVHFPPVIELRHSAPQPGPNFARAPSAAMTDELDGPDIMINADPGIGLQRNTRIIVESIRQQQCRRVFETLLDYRVQVQRACNPRHQRTFQSVQIGKQVHETQVIRLVEIDQRGQVPTSVSFEGACLQHVHSGNILTQLAKNQSLIAVFQL